MASEYTGRVTARERFPEVEAARLLLIVARFAEPFDASTALSYAPSRPVAGHFTPEYYLHKLDFLLRYPGYFVYELTELHRMGVTTAANRDDVVGIIRSVLADKEPEMRTLPVQRFWRGAYESIDDVEAWWHSRQLIYVTIQSRTNARPQKHFFPTELAYSEAKRMVSEVEYAKWYQDRIDLIHRLFGHFTPAQVKNLQYSHPAYREAQLRELIPDLSRKEITRNFETVFGEELEVAIEQ